MTVLTLRSGDLFASTADAIGHGVNGHNAMSSGIAVLFRFRYPEMHEMYGVRCAAGLLTPGTIFAWYDDTAHVIYNIASQDLPGADARLDWLNVGVRAALADCDARGYKSLALPRIGCGVGGLNWADVEPVLRAAAADYECDLEAWTL